MSFFPANLRFLRTLHGQSLSDLALTLGVWEDILKRYEAGQAEPGCELLVQIADQFHCPLDHLLRRDLMAQHRLTEKLDIRFVILDVDGTLTDGGMYYSLDGNEMRRFHAHDGIIIHRLVQRQGIRFGFLSAGMAEPILRKRAEMLGVAHVYAGTRPKLEVAREWLEALQLDFAQTACAGDDLNDIPLLQRAGFSACPADAVPQVKQAVHRVLRRRGGDACVREFLEEVLGFNVA